MFFRQIFDRKLAQYAYIIGCQETGEAIVVDPMRNLAAYDAICEEEELKIVAATETHIHADFLSGLREFAARGATVYASDEGGNDWRYQWLDEEGYDARRLTNGATIDVGNIELRAVHTPGHTPEHLCFLVTDTAAGREPMGLLSGDFVFVGDVGRPDLLETAAGTVGAMEPSARELYRSLQAFRELPPHIQIWPGHGAGSACGKALGAVPTTTVGYELAVSPAMRAAGSEDEFVSYVLDGQPEPPVYFARMKRQNKEGPRVLGKWPAVRRVHDGKLIELSGATGVAVLDTRPWEQYQRGHLPGSFHAPLNSRFNTVAGSFVPDEMPIYLIIEPEQLEEAVIDLIHVGLDRIIGYATPEMFTNYLGKGKVDAIEEIDAAALDDKLTPEDFLLDVRRAVELKAEGFIAGAHNIAHTRLVDRLDEIPKDRRIVVYCLTGVRSGYTCGLLDRMGYRVANVAGGLEAWQATGGVVATS